MTASGRLGDLDGSGVAADPLRAGNTSLVGRERARGVRDETADRAGRRGQACPGGAAVVRERPQLRVDRRLEVVRLEIARCVVGERVAGARGASTELAVGAGAVRECDHRLPDLQVGGSHEHVRAGRALVARDRRMVEDESRGLHDHDPAAEVGRGVSAHGRVADGRSCPGTADVDEIPPPPLAANEAALALTVESTTSSEPAGKPEKAGDRDPATGVGRVCRHRRAGERDCRSGRVEPAAAECSCPVVRERGIRDRQRRRRTRSRCRRPASSRRFRSRSSS